MTLRVNVILIVCSNNQATHFYKGTYKYVLTEDVSALISFSKSF